MPKTELVAVGLTTLDILASPVDGLPPPDGFALVEDIHLTAAGTAAGCALVAAHLRGESTTIVSAVGADAQGHLVRSILSEKGVDVSMLAVAENHGTSTTLLPVQSDGNRPNLHMLGASFFATIPPKAYQSLDNAAVVHWGAVGLPGMSPTGAEFLAAARQAGAFVTCDLIAPQDGTAAELELLLPHVDLFMPSISEVEFLTGTSDPAAAAEKFMAQGAKGCLFKIGADGAYYATRTEQFHIPAFAIDPVDTTSCGDAFCAGFITARIKGFAAEDCVRFAAAVAAHVAMGLGTLGKLGSFEDCLAFMQTAPTNSGRSQ